MKKASLTILLTGKGISGSSSQVMKLLSRDSLPFNGLAMIDSNRAFAKLFSFRI